jgi:hypothetical protein
MDVRQSDKKVVVVTGDVTLDWHIVRITGGQERKKQWTAEDCTRACRQPGGAAMLGRLLEVVMEKLNLGNPGHFSLAQRPLAWGAVRPIAEACHLSFALWSQHEKIRQRPQDYVWRVAEFLGMDRCLAENLPQECSQAASPEAIIATRTDEEDPHAFIVVVDDADLGFRTRPDLWPAALTSPGIHPWILLKMASPVAQGELWQYLYHNHADRLIVVIPIDDLRRTEVKVSRDLSWERTAQDLLWELLANPRINCLSRCAHLVVSFNTAGALLLSRGKGKPEATLFFDPKVMEGMWEQNYPGQMIGYTTCLAAALARQLLLMADTAQVRDNLTRGIMSGLAAVRKLHQEGYELATAGGRRPQLAFPYRLIAGELEANPGTAFEAANLPLPQSHPSAASSAFARSSSWSLLKATYQDNLDNLARNIVLAGPEAALTGVPLGQFGGLLTADRREIENLRNIRNLIREYCDNTRAAKPIAIAVFGPPGSGKSFAIKQLAKSLPEIPIPLQPLEFNLSQFQASEELLGAFHQVRDVSLRGELPLVFWDEFDTELGNKPLGWLRYFLAPIQDGVFQSGQITHPIGRAIFVFAGGTSATMAGFAQLLPLEQFRSVKGPDFISRLRGYVNIMGPNRQEPADNSDDNADPYYLIRRAIMLRVLLRQHKPKLFKPDESGRDILRIDPGVLHAFLAIEKYLHGARSMESIITMSPLAQATTFERSSLPSETQLNLHVDGSKFLDLVQGYVLEDLVDELAVQVNLVYCRCYPEACWPTDFQELSEGLKETNRGFARDIPKKLFSLGYLMVRTQGPILRRRFGSRPIELLAEMEHDRWLEQKIDLGWRYHRFRDNAQRLHPALLPWRRLTAAERAALPPLKKIALGQGVLPEAEKVKNRCLVAAIPEIVEQAGFALVRTPRPPGDARLLVGVTGHRILMEQGKITAAIAKALNRIEHSYPGKSLTMLSPLAEGADRLVVHQVLVRPEACLVAVLPLEEEDYLADFATEASQTEFRFLVEMAEEIMPLPPATDRDEAYAAGGRYIIDHCDVLVAVWDGQEEQGQGGTGGMVAQARARKLPLAWIKAGNRRPGTEEPTSLGAEQGKVVFENFP